MENFWEDISQQLNSYYDQVIELLPKLALGILAFLIAYSIANWLRRVSSKRLGPRMDDPLLANFLSRMIRFIVLSIGFLVVLQIIGLGNIAGSIMGAAGVGAFVLGFAFKDIGENFLAGIIMAFNRPFRIGDIVEAGGVKGKIISLALRHTQIKTFDGKDAYIPNGQIIRNTIINYTIDGFLRYDFNIGLDYGSDIVEAFKVIDQVLHQTQGVLTEDKKPFIMIDELAASTINLKILFWVDTLDDGIPDYQTKNIAMRQVVTALDKAGFNMPSDIIEIKNYKKEELRTKSRAEEKAA